MPYEVAWEPRGVRLSLRGHVTAAELLLAFSELSGHEQFSEARYLLCDLTAVDALQADPADIEYLAAMTKAAVLSNSRCVAAYVVRDRSVTAFVELFASQLAPGRMREIVGSEADARAWIARCYPGAEWTTAS